MNPSLADQLKNIKLDTDSYGQLPLRDNLLYTIEQLPEQKCAAMLKQWELLNMFRKQLKILDRYLSSNKGETLSEWLTLNKQGISNTVIDKIGNYNDATKGISVYFLNVQNAYDNNEAIYDAMETDKDMPEWEVKDSEPMRTIRADKRSNRSKARNIMLKDFAKDDKGYLIVEIEVPGGGSTDSQQNTTEPSAQPANIPASAPPTPNAETINASGGKSNNGSKPNTGNKPKTVNASGSHPTGNKSDKPGPAPTPIEPGKKEPMNTAENIKLGANAEISNPQDNTNNTTTDNTTQKTTDDKTKSVTEAVKKSGNMTVKFAGAIILIAVVFVVASSITNEKK